MSNYTAHHNNEERLNERHGVIIDGQEHLFSMNVGGETFSIPTIHDVSVSGMGLETTHSFETGTDVTLNYSEGDFTLDIKAAVMWCNGVEGSDKHALGLQFDISNGGNNSMFFLAMRKYLDEFDGASITE